MQQVAPQNLAMWIEEKESDLQELLEMVEDFKHLAGQIFPEDAPEEEQTRWQRVLGVKNPQEFLMGTGRQDVRIKAMQSQLESSKKIFLV